MKREPINYSNYRPYYTRGKVQEEYYKLKRREKRKNRLKKAGYFVAGIATTIGIGYVAKKICGNLDLGVCVDVSSNESQVMIHELVPKAPFIIKGFPMNRDVCLKPEIAKDIGEKLISHAEGLIKKE